MLVSFYDIQDFDEIYDAVVTNLTTIKMYKANENNRLLLNSYEKAVNYLDNFVMNFNSFYNKVSKSTDEVRKKYKNVILTTGINEPIINFDEFNDFVSSLDLSIREKGELKKEVGKSNIRLMLCEKDINLNKELFDEIDSLLEEEKELLDSCDSTELSNYLNSSNLSLEEQNRFRIISILLALRSEREKAIINKYNKVVYNTSVKLIKEYLNVYCKLKGLEQDKKLK